MQLKSIASRAQCAWFEEQRVPRRRCCEPSGWGIDRPEGAAPGFLLPVMLVPTALNVSCDDEDAVWPPEPREEAGLATDAHLFKEAFKQSFRVTRRAISHYLHTDRTVAACVRPVHGAPARVVPTPPRSARWDQTMCTSCRLI